ncbi:hypothetical protein [Conexibacter woesei]|uniref:hypothetical protein n=1 Tax=Conexibacter woesei TaxID=191495 RepID=UPI000426DF08|nr:hypothetical protein [Conexibacter woesei]
MIAEDRTRLLEFLDRLRGEDLPRSMEALDPELQAYAFAAWDELLGSGAFELLREALASGEFDEGLDRNGLGGAQLTFKLAVVDRARREADREEQSRGPGFFGRVRRKLAKLLAGSDVVLDSILSAIPVAGDALRELKEAVGIGLED